MSIGHGWVTDDWRLLTADGVDADLDMDLVGATAQVTFVPNVTLHRQVMDQDGSIYSLIIESVSFAYRDGRLVSNDGTDGVSLVSEVGGTPIVWHVTRSVNRVSGGVYKDPPFPVRLHTDGTVHLPSVDPVRPDQIPEITDLFIDVDSVVNEVRGYANSALGAAEGAAADVRAELSDVAQEAEAAAEGAAGAAVSAGRDAARAEAAAGKLDASTFLTGTGFPEGKVTAPVGATYTDTAATNGAVRWIKTSGTGNTGWQVEYGDTGWRNISEMFDPPLTSGSIRVRKTAESVQFLFYYAAVPDGAIALLTSSFGTGTSQNAPIYSAGGANSGVILSHYSGRLTVSRATTTINYGFTLPSVTPWPTTLPGIPV